jgi:hypothetical protein
LLHSVTWSEEGQESHLFTILVLSRQIAVMLQRLDIAGRLEVPYCMTRPRMVLIGTGPNWRLSIELRLLSPTTKQWPAGIVTETTW